MGLFDSINKSTGVIKKKSDNQRVVNLMKNPPKERTVPTIRNFERNSRHQADLLFLPEDSKTKDRYALVIVDTTTRYADAEGIPDKEPSTVLAAMKKIYNRSFLSKPTVAFETDDGSEFTKEVQSYLKANNIQHKIARAGRSRQVALAEYLNYIIGKSVYAKQHQEEWKTGTRNKDWVGILPKIVRAYNKYVSDKPQNTKSTKKQIMETPTIRCKGMSCLLLKKETRVRVIADRAIDPLTKKVLSKKFRATDYKWDPRTRKITKVILMPGQPPMYRVSGITNAAYTREQLQLVDEDEKRADYDPNRKWIVEKIIKRTKKNGHIAYEVLWKDSDDGETTIETRASLMKQAPAVVKSFEKKHKSVKAVKNKRAKKRK